MFNNLLSFPNRLHSITSLIRTLPSITTNATICFSSTSTNDFLCSTSISWTGVISFSQVKKFGPFHHNSDPANFLGDTTRVATSAGLTLVGT